MTDKKNEIWKGLVKRWWHWMLPHPSGWDKFNFMTVLNCKCRRSAWQHARSIRRGKKKRRRRKSDRFGRHIRQMRAEGRANHVVEVKSFERRRSNCFSRWGDSRIKVTVQCGDGIPEFFIWTMWEELRGECFLGQIVFYSMPHSSGILSSWFGFLPIGWQPSCRLNLMGLCRSHVGVTYIYIYIFSL